jgi:hypothetical protein
MKTKFEISNEIFTSATSLKECFDYYEKEYKSKGFILDKENQNVYIILDQEIHLNEGDRVDFYGYRKVTWKCLNIHENIVEYSLEEE